MDQPSPDTPQPITRAPLSAGFRRDEVELACVIFEKLSVGADVAIMARSAAGVRLHRRFLVLREQLRGASAEGGI